MIGNTVQGETKVLSMSWKNTDEYRERLKFIGDWLKGEFSFSDLCSRYGISRKTGYKLINRYKEEGEQALRPRTHARHHHPNATPHVIQKRILELKHRFPYWGPDKLRDWLLLNEGHERWPAASTIGDILKKHGLVKPRKTRRHVPAHSEPFAECSAPNDVWSADFKGQFKVGANYCYPLTISDNYSRFLLTCKGLKHPALKETMAGFEQAFIEFGLPEAIKTDNGQPFAGLSIGGLTRLSIWLLKLGIMPERIQKGHPEQNGRHERMHRTLKEATALPPKNTFLEQQFSFDQFRNEYNYERPHQALDGQRPADVYQSSRRNLPQRIPEMIYPDDFEIRKVRSNGEIRWYGKHYFISELLYREPVGLQIIDDGRALIHFGRLKLGILDAREDKIIRA
jgi:transposase InsO family protein